MSPEEASGRVCAGCSRPESAERKLLRARANGVPLTICSTCVDECVEAIADAPTRVPGKNRACSFCQTAEGSVAVMLVVGSALICDECVDGYKAALKA